MYVCMYLCPNRVLNSNFSTESAKNWSCPLLYSIYSSDLVKNACFRLHIPDLLQEPKTSYSNPFSRQNNSAQCGATKRFSLSLRSSLFSYTNCMDNDHAFFWASIFSWCQLVQLSIEPSFLVSSMVSITNEALILLKFRSTSADSLPGPRTVASNPIVQRKSITVGGSKKR